MLLAIFICGTVKYPYINLHINLFYVYDPKRSEKMCILHYNPTINNDIFYISQNILVQNTALFYFKMPW